MKLPPTAKKKKVFDGKEKLDSLKKYNKERENKILLGF